MLTKLKSVLLFILMLFVVSGCERITDTVVQPPDISDSQPLTVMTYNVYVGSSAEPLLTVENLLAVPGEVAKMYNNVIASDFPSRATAIAKSIKTYQPHVIGLQEISLVRRQSPGDFIPDNPTLAEEVVMDYLQILIDALHSEGLNYEVAAQIENIDIEMPMLTEKGLDDIRLTDYDVILSRSDVEISNPMSTNYTNALTIEMLGLVIHRGYAAVDATVSGVTYRFVNTHLEAYTEVIRVAQTQELIDILADETLPIILVGDFNTRAPNGTGYQKILAAGYHDLWQMDSEGSGNTCCQDGDLLNEITDNTGRIDHIYVRNFGHSISVKTHTVGDKSTDRLNSGLWPSDHAGVVAEITFE
ncbi:MAG: endonuclease/exonuclease/phosphatase family protein [Candidatus Poribacteria bacterium]|nr:endonuclease/exonuclease/phosphatase family protein [Candidatus Poribacteria bacterium]